MESSVTIIHQLSSVHVKHDASQTDSTGIVCKYSYLSLIFENVKTLQCIKISLLACAIGQTVAKCFFMPFNQQTELEFLCSYKLNTYLYGSLNNGCLYLEFGGKLVCNGKWCTQ